MKEKGHKDKKVLVAVTDGNDNASAVSLENLVKAAQQSEVLIYAIGILRGRTTGGAARPQGVEHGYRRRGVLSQGCG